ncbi:putative RNA-directed DNA polymerase from transposon X-element [Dissostichus eleginoides]|uniref:RNA-directed DNA polymerase from transposon X-element n=1 Tax=Dissostichus eleginoides TaxID=100907 RepID=A0AAD9FDR4_DISEL|nr:putative RNA-directed DNA polymerase from transposon X-element [Dissostichus eleginoides]
MVTTAEVLKKLSALQPNKATGHDNIPSKFLRDSAAAITPVITHIINLSIKQGHVPKDFKIARVTPLHKKGSKLDPGNYRPVSILTSISKVMEKIVYEQDEKYLAEKNLIYEFQSGFRTSHSTDTCLLYLNDHIKQEVDAGKYCGMVMLDLQKAFDTVNHSILIDKLKAIGFDSLSVSWMQSYLEGREQMVEVNGTLSPPLPVSCGVPQGSILGPLLFLIYANDMSSACDCNLFLFADDSALLVSGKNKLQVEKTLSSELGRICTWLADNKLSLHLGKTESILFGSKIKLSKTDGFSVTVGDNIVTRKDEITYLGSILEANLPVTKWHPV